MNRKKLVYSILRELEQGNKPKRADYELDLEQWGELAELIRDEEYAKSVIVQRAGIGNKVVSAWYTSAKITMKGVEYLEENSFLSKTYKGMKEFRDWLKL